MDAPFLSLPEVFFSPALIQDLAEKDQLNDKEKIAYMHLLWNNLEASLRAFKESRLTAFDALVGDYGCQLHMLEILNLAESPEFEAEVDRLIERAKRVNEEMKKMKSQLVPKGKKDYCPVAPGGIVRKFFNEQMRTIPISDRMAYLLQCHLLTFTKVPVDAVKEKIEISRFEKLVHGGKITLSNDVKQQIVNKAQSQLSESSIDFLRNEAGEIFTLPQKQLSLMLSMLAPNRIKQHSSCRGNLPISHACQFYSMKAVLCRLREMRTLIVVKKWLVTKEDKGIPLLFFRASEPGGPFVRVPAEAIRELPEEMPVAVMEGIVSPHLGSEELATYLQKHELGEVVLVDTAQENQFEQGRSGLDEVPQEAREEIEEYRRKASEIKSIKDSREAFFWLDHMYCSSLGDELRSLS